MDQTNQEEKSKSAKELLIDAEEGKGNGGRFNIEKEKTIEIKELSLEEKMAHEAIEQELKLMDHDDNLKKESENKAKQIQAMGDEDKIDNLLKIAKEKGVAYAVKVAKSMNDPYVLDIFHDVLVREGLWKKFKE